WSAFKENLQENGFTLGFGVVGIGLLPDPANHRCCTAEPPEEVEVGIEDGMLTVSSEDTER
ncbi:MAG: hypothetical protein ACKVKR_03905, partial [Pseudomonadales bacterium]